MYNDHYCHRELVFDMAFVNGAPCVMLWLLTGFYVNACFVMANVVAVFSSCNLIVRLLTFFVFCRKKR